MRARHGKYRKRRSHRPVIVAAALVGQFLAALYLGSDLLLGLATSIVVLAVAWIVLRKLVRAVVAVKRVFALVFIGLGIALDKQTRQTFRETWQENAGPVDDVPFVSEEELVQFA